MEDKGGGDGIWDLSIMTFMQFTFSGSEGTVYIDDITIGSTEEYKYDTTEEAAKGIAPGILETFESEDLSSKLSENFNISNVDTSLTAIKESTDGSGRILFQKSGSRIGSAEAGTPETGSKDTGGYSFNLYQAFER